MLDSRSLVVTASLLLSACSTDLHSVEFAIDGAPKDLTPLEHRIGGLFGTPAARKVRVQGSNPMELTYYVDERPGSELLREVRARLEYGGRIELHVVAEPEDLADQDRSLADEAERLVAWLEANPKGTLTAFNDLRAEEGGSDSLVWYVRRPVPGQSDGGLPVACLAPSLLADAAWVFDSDSVAGAAASQGPTGHFGVAVEVNAERESAFRAFTEHYVGRKLAIVVDGRAWSTPVLAQPLTNSFFLDAGLDEAGAEALAAAIRSPFPWPVRFVGVR